MINALEPYAGAKRSQSAGIVEALGGHQAYWEPMCGSLSVLLAKPRCSVEVVNDLNGATVNLARVVQDDDLAPRLFDRLLRTQFNQALHKASCEWLKGYPQDPQVVPHLDWAYHHFVAAWQGRNGLSGTTAEAQPAGFCRRFTTSGGDPAVRFRAAVDSVPAWWDRLRGVTVLRMDAFELLGRIEDTAGTACYVDPPYVSKKVKYKHDFTPAGHDRLAGLLGRFTKTRVVVSYYAHPSLARLYPKPDWVWVDKATKKNMTNRATEAPEVLLVKNGAI